MQIRSLPLDCKTLTLLSLLACSSCGGETPQETPASGPPAEAIDAAQSTEASKAPSKSEGETTENPDAADSSLPDPVASSGDVLYPQFPQGTKPVDAMYAHVDMLKARPDIKENRIKVQHVLIGVGSRFGGALPAQAEKRAAEVLQELAASGGENFDELVKKHTNDAYPGIYTMLSEGSPDRASQVYLRSDMVAAFGDVGWKLKVGEVGVSPYDPPPPSGKNTSPFGLHIIKRLE